MRFYSPGGRVGRHDAMSEATGLNDSELPCPSSSSFRDGSTVITIDFETG
jgi:hypothetical protein